MHLLVEATPGKKLYRSRCGLKFPIKVSTLSVWGSDITCEVCRGR